MKWKWQKLDLEGATAAGAGEVPAPASAPAPALSQWLYGKTAPLNCSTYHNEVVHVVINHTTSQHVLVLDVNQSPRHCCLAD